MQDNRCATSEEVALLRERVARVEGGMTTFVTGWIRYRVSFLICGGI